MIILYFKIPYNVVEDIITALWLIKMQFTCSCIIPLFNVCPDKVTSQNVLCQVTATFDLLTCILLESKWTSALKEFLRTGSEDGSTKIFSGR